MTTVKKLPRRASEETFNELHKLLTEEFLIKIQSGEATTADLKAAGDWLFKNDITGVAVDNTALGKLADIMPSIDFDAVQKAVKFNGSKT
tara:strand:+ start:401 stop:670 length:270 start_codon:yes stop_codon:yes gene_type:complete